MDQHALICREPDGAPRGDLLFVHGMAVENWIWEETALPAFAEAGYRVWALTLPKRAANASLGLYGEAIGDALTAIGAPTVVIGHSLGGAALQQALASGHRMAGAVLLCSVPPYGLWRASLEMAVTAPALWRELAVFCMKGLAHTDIGVLRTGLFPSGVDAAVFNDLIRRAGDEPLAAMQRAVGWPPFAPLPLSQRGMLVIGGARDRFVPETDVRLTAAYYGVEPHVIENAGHMMMYEPEGQQAARITLDWLDRVAA